MTNVKKSGLEKFLLKGLGKRNYYRITDALRFDEDFYVAYHSDVREAINRGVFKSGKQHYRRHGFIEGRATHNDVGRLLSRKIGNLMEPVSTRRWRSLEKKLRPVKAGLSPYRYPVTNVFIPTMDPNIFFGGYIAFFHFLCRLAEAGTRLRFVVLEDSCDLQWFLKGISDRQSWMEAFKSAEFENLSARKKTLDVHKDDAVIVYSAWMALAARGVIPLLASKRAVFFIQEFEAVFHEYDSLGFLVNSAYRVPHVPIFNSRALHDYFRKHQIGVFAHSDKDQLSFEHNIGTTGEHQRSHTFRKRLLFYARPERHAGRNLCDIGILALRAAVAAGILDHSWDIVGIGSLVHEYCVPLDERGRINLNILPRVPEHEYDAFINGFDVGLSLMSSAHSGVVHFEWVMRGIATVINCTQERDKAFFDSYDLPIVPASPDIEGIVQALSEAINIAKEGFKPSGKATRTFGRSWDEAFSPEFIAKAISACAIPLESKSEVLEVAI